MLRAYDKATGENVAEVYMPAPPRVWPAIMAGLSATVPGMKWSLRSSVICPMIS